MREQARKLHHFSSAIEMSGLILLCSLLANIFCFDSSNSDNSFVKIANSGAETSLGNEITEGYVEKANNLLLDYKARKIQHETLNIFGKGVEEYFLLRLYEGSSIRLRNIPVLDISFPYKLPDYSDEAITFKNVSVHEFPGLRKYGNRVTIDYTAAGAAYEVTMKCKSDVTIFTGYFDIYNTTNFFVFVTKQNVLTIIDKAAQQQGKKLLPAKHSWQYDGAGELTHTYDSSYQRYAEANEIANEHWRKALDRYLSDSLLPEAHQYSFMTPFHQTDVKITSTRQKSILSTLVESAVQYATAKGLNSFEASPINYTNQVGSRVFIQAYKDIKVEGLLNFVDYRLINSTTEPENNTDTKFTDAFELTYASEGDKQAFVSFVVSDGRRENGKKFKINSVRIVAVYNSPILEEPRRVFRNRRAFFNGSGFLVLLDVDNYDPVYEFLFRHIGNDISRAFDRILGPDVVT